MRHTSNRSARFRRRSGNAVLDMAFVLPILLALTFGAVEYGYALYLKHALQGAAREGARAAIVANAKASEVQAAVDTSMQVSGFPQSKYTRPPTITPANWAASAAGTTITVTVQTTWGTAGIRVLPTFMGGISTSKVLTGGTTMRKEG
jgi:Flp pilus assembly protein TadG